MFENENDVVVDRSRDAAATALKQIDDGFVMADEIKIQKFK